MSVVTPTRNRPETLELCKLWISRQTYPNIEHVVVHDEEGRGPNVTSGEAIRKAAGYYIVAVDDDDWYAPEYVAMCVKMLKQYPLVGHKIKRVYHLGVMRYLTWKGKGPLPGSIAFRRSVIPDALWLTDPRRVGKPGPKSLKNLRQKHRCLAYSGGEQIVMIKGIYPWGGRSKGHDPKKFPHHDPKAAKLKGWIGEEDAERYLAISVGGNSHPKPARSP